MYLSYITMFIIWRISVVARLNYSKNIYVYSMNPKSVGNLNYFEKLGNYHAHICSSNILKKIYVTMMKLIFKLKH